MPLDSASERKYSRRESPNPPPSTAEQAPTKPNRPIINPYRFVALTVLLLVNFAVDPALAQTDTPCPPEELIKMLEGFFQLTTGLGALGLVFVWQLDSFAELITLTREQREALQRHKRQALKSALILFTLGPLYTMAGPMLGLPFTECGIDLIPL